MPADDINRSLDAICAKRDGAVLSAASYRHLVDDLTKGRLSDAQAGAFLMAATINGLTDAEAAGLCMAMVASGKRRSWTSMHPLVDKHSTGGVGDKVSLVLAPLAAACGLSVPMFSGRGLGMTGGTIDKLSAISGFRSDLSDERLQAVLDAAGCFIAAGDQLVPADARLYALRDATGTAECPGLIASSIMAKKITAGAASLLVDVKVGAGAFCANLESARALAELMVDIGEAADLSTACVLTTMDFVLGATAGNACEVQEAIAVLQGRGPKEIADLAITQVAVMAAQVRADLPLSVIARRLQDGSAYERFCAMCMAQGADPGPRIARPKASLVVRAAKNGEFTGCRADLLGRAVWHCGAGRARPDAPVDVTAGARILATPGDRISAGEEIVVLEGADRGALESAAALATESVVVDGYRRARVLGWVDAP